MRPLQIGPVTLPSNLVLAPMSGVTDYPFRQLVKECSGDAVGMMMTEFIVSDLFRFAPHIAHKQLRFDPNEKPLGAQLFGADLDSLLYATERVQNAGPTLIDLNCGCPSPKSKVTRKGGGAGLLRDLNALHTILRALVRASDLPITLKTRPGWDDQSIVAHDVLALAQDAGVAMLSIHGRTRAALYKGRADWDIVAQLAAHATIPILGSGDIHTWDDIQRVTHNTKISGVMIGRAALRNPFLFATIHAQSQNQPLPITDLREKLRILTTYHTRLQDHHKPGRVHARLKRIASAFVHGHPQSAKLRRDIYTSTSPQATLEKVQRFLHTHPFDDPTR